MTDKKYIDNDVVKFGEHLIFDAYGCNPKNLDSEDFCLNILSRMLKLAGMKKLHEPVIVRAESNEVLGGKDPGGISAFLMIQESHISMHTFTKRGFVTIDIYSCKTFDSTGIISFLKKELECKDADIIKVERGLKYPADNIF